MRSFYRFDEAMGDDLFEELALSVHRSHQEVLKRALEEGPPKASMQTTLTKVHILWPNAYIVQVGDSRCYLVREGSIRRLTKDQTVGQHLIDQGAIEPNSPAAFRWAHVLTESIGGKSSDPSPAISKVQLARGDALLLCTDGLTNHVPEPEIAAAVKGNSSAEAACRELVDAALDRGGKDNVTMVLGRFS